MEEICNQLVDGRRKWHDADARPRSSIPGIYAIGEVSGQGKMEIIYVGHSKDVRRRLNEHFNPNRSEEQAINKYIHKQKMLGNLENIKIRALEDPDHEENEGEYLCCIAKKLRKWPRFNINHGDGNTKCSKNY